MLVVGSVSEVAGMVGCVVTVVDPVAVEVEAGVL